jgi:hypothetical protein
VLRVTAEVYKSRLSFDVLSRLGTKTKATCETETSTSTSTRRRRMLMSSTENRPETRGTSWRRFQSLSQYACTARISTSGNSHVRVYTAHAAQLANSVLRMSRVEAIQYNFKVRRKAYGVGDPASSLIRKQPTHEDAQLGIDLCQHESSHIIFTVS